MLSRLLIPSLFAFTLFLAPSAVAQTEQIPATQNEQMNDPQPLNRAGRNMEPKVVARGRSVIIRPGLRSIYVTDAGEPRVVADTRREFVLERTFNSMAIRPLTQQSEIILPARDVIPDGRAGKGQNTIEEAWLIQPTSRYPHGALGDNIEAGALRVILKNGAVSAFRLSDGSVFEGLQPTIGDVDGDGTDEVLVVNSNAQRGSVLQIYKPVDLGNGVTRLQMIGEGLGTGRKNRWLNPVGVGDFNQDGYPEIAVVHLPHIEGVLSVHQFRNGRFQELARMTGFSNHAHGSPQTAMNIIRDITGDNRPDLIVPALDRRALRVMTMNGRDLVEIGQLQLPSPVKTDILWIEDALTLGLEDNSVLSLSVFIQ
ncbi:MAG: VCBS repeat-containing protein [Alphaproteobacteria bacterium]|nr:VCBS repeat-containing protein [Alphaproteobacteria bacterium SS10]